MHFGRPSLFMGSDTPRLLNIKEKNVVDAGQVEQLGVDQRTRASGLVWMQQNAG